MTSLPRGLQPVRSSVLLATVLLAGALVGCDPTVNSFDDNGQDYSLFGYLDASADTQFVRVEPLRDSMLTRAPATLDAEVTLTTLNSGRSVPLQDSLFHFLDGATTHNYYTTTDIEPMTSYRLVVRGPEEAESRVETTVPTTFPPPTPIADVETPVCDPYDAEPAVLRVRDIDRLVAVKALYYRANPRTVWDFNHLPDTLQVGNGVVHATIDHGEDICDIPRDRDGQTSVYRIDVVVAAGDPQWPDFMGLTLDTHVLPKGSSNVEGGIGFVGGIVTDTVTIYPDN